LKGLSVEIEQPPQAQAVNLDKEEPFPTRQASITSQLTGLFQPEANFPASKVAFINAKAFQILHEPVQNTNSKAIGCFASIDLSRNGVFPDLGIEKMFQILEQTRLEMTIANRKIESLQSDIKYLKKKNREFKEKNSNLEGMLTEERGLREETFARLGNDLKFIKNKDLGMVSKGVIESSQIKLKPNVIMKSPPLFINIDDVEENPISTKMENSTSCMESSVKIIRNNWAQRQPVARQQICKSSRSIAIVEDKNTIYNDQGKKQTAYMKKIQGNQKLLNLPKIQSTLPANPNIHKKYSVIDNMEKKMRPPLPFSCPQISSSM